MTRISDATVARAWDVLVAGGWHPPAHPSSALSELLESNLGRSLFVEHRPLHKDDPAPYRAHVYGDGFDYHAIGETPAEALMRVGEHWHIETEKKRVSERTSAQKERHTTDK